MHAKKSCARLIAANETMFVLLDALFRRLWITSTAGLGCCSSKTEPSVGLLYRAGRSALGKRWPAHDTPERTALHRPRWRCLDRAGGLGCRWRLNPARALVIHGRALRRKISQRLRPARCRLWPKDAALARSRSHVLQRDALQRREPDRSKDNVLRIISPRQALEIPARDCHRGRARRANCPPRITSERRGDRGNQKLDRERESIAVPNRSPSCRSAIAIAVSIRK